MAIVTYKDIVKQLTLLENEYLKKIDKQILPVYNKLESYVLGLYKSYGSKEILSYSEFLKYGRDLILESMLKDTIKGIQKELYATLYEGVISFFIESFYMNYYYFENSYGDSVDIQVLGMSDIKDLVIVSIAGLTMQDRLTKWSNEFLYKYKQTLHQGLSQGKEVKKILSDLEFDTNTYNNHVKTLFVSESNKSKSKATEYIYDKASKKGIEFKKQWVATLDKKTRDSHRALDGRFSDADGYFHYAGYKTLAPSLFGVPKLDINCRCTTIANFGETPSNRKENLKPKTIIKYKNYEQWYKEKGFK